LRIRLYSCGAPRGQKRRSAKASVVTLVRSWGTLEDKREVGVCHVPTLGIPSFAGPFLPG